ncbi:hypothetical protein TD95_004118, partial [Thielaviopsis punctulata]
ASATQSRSQSPFAAPAFSPPPVSTSTTTTTTSSSSSSVPAPASAAASTQASVSSSAPSSPPPYSRSPPSAKPFSASRTPRYSSTRVDLSASTRDYPTTSTTSNTNPTHTVPVPVPVSSSSSSSATSTSTPPSTSSAPSTSAPASSVPPLSASTSASPQTTPKRSSLSFIRHSKDFGIGGSRRSKQATADRDIHPLNLPPEERQRLSTQRLSQQLHQKQKKQQKQQKHQSQPIFTMSDPNQMDVDESASASTSVPSSSTPAPTPPPHRSTPTSPKSSAKSTVDEAETHKNNGNRFFKEKNYKSAIEEYSRAISLIPNSATYLSNRAAAYMSNHQLEAALDDCSKAAKMDPSNSKILLRLARIYTGLGRPDDAMMSFSRIQPPPSANDMRVAKEMRNHVSAAQDALKNGTAGSMILHALDQAERLLNTGAPKPRKWQLMRGAAYLNMGGANSLGEVQNIAMQLLRQNSQDPEALVLRGRALYGQGENDKAVQHFRKALNCDPEFSDAKKYLRIVQKLDRMKEQGNNEYRAGQWQAAIDRYTEALTIDPANRGTNSKLLQNRALCRIKLREYEEAIADCEKAIGLDPQYLKARKTKANAYGLAGKWEDSVREWKSVHEMDPEDRTILKEIRKAEIELKKSQRKDYYKILGVEKTADDNAIKKAYRKLAIVHHPDKNPNDPQAEERFKDISEAYENLSDPQKRAAFDNGDDIDMSDMFGGGGGFPGGGMGAQHIDPEILFNMMGGQGGGFRGGGFGGFPGGFGGQRGSSFGNGSSFHFS